MLSTLLDGDPSIHKDASITMIWDGALVLCNLGIILKLVQVYSCPSHMSSKSTLCNAHSQPILPKWRLTCEPIACGTPCTSHSHLRNGKCTSGHPCPITLGKHRLVTQHLFWGSWNSMLHCLRKLGQAFATPVDSGYNFWGFLGLASKPSIMDELRFAFTATLLQCLTYGLTGILCQWWA